MIKKVILIRHGESEKDKSKPDRNLTDDGRAQIKKTSRAMASVVRGRRAEIIATTTPRAIQSAEILSRELRVPFWKTFPKLMVENIKRIQSDTTKDLTFRYFELFTRGQLPRDIPTPLAMVKRFEDALVAIKEKDIAIIVGHSGALEAFANYQKVFVPEERLSRELNYAEFVVLERKR